MGLVRVTAEIGKNREMAVPVQFLVDTGSLTLASDLRWQRS